MSSMSAQAEGKDPAEIATIRAWEAEERMYWARQVARNPPNSIPPMGDVIPGTSPTVITDAEIDKLSYERQQETLEALNMPKPVSGAQADVASAPARRIVQEAPAEQGLADTLESETQKMAAAQRALGIPDEGDVPTAIGMLIS